MSQPTLPGLAEQQELPFPTLTLKRQTYKLFGLVTHLDWEGERIVNWMYERCGKSEEAHSVMKSDLAGGKLPSSDFGENAAWWHFVILVHRFGSSPTKGHRIASASGSSHRQLHDGGYPPFLPFQPVFVPNTG